MADQRILRGVAATLSWQPVDSDGEASAPVGTVTVHVTRSDGTDVLADGTATIGTGSNPRRAALTADLTGDLDLLTAVWTDSGSEFTTTAEVVGGFYFSVAEARASDPALRNDTKFPTATLISARQDVESEFETICGVAFVPRFELEVVDTSGIISLHWPQIRTVRSIESWDGSTWTALTDLSCVRTTDTGSLFGPFWNGHRYRIAYEHGFDRPPADLKTAALVRLRNRASATATGIPDRATSFSISEGGTYSLDRADAFKTGIPEVDGALGRYEQRSRIA